MKDSFRTNPYLRLVLNPQAYKNIAYLLLAFPTGLMYFLLLVIGSALGFGMLVIGVGLLILWATFIMTQFGARLERWLANKLLAANIPPQEESIVSIKAVGNGDNWMAILFLFLKFPLGIVSFALTTGVISATLGLIIAPFMYSVDTVMVGFREIDTLWEALLASGFGLILLPVALIFLAKIASAWRGLSRRLLDVSYNEEKRKHTISDSAMDRLSDDIEDGEIAYCQRPTAKASGLEKARVDQP